MAQEQETFKAGRLVEDTTRWAVIARSERGGRICVWAGEPLGDDEARREAAEAVAARLNAALVTND